MKIERANLTVHAFFPKKRDGLRFLTRYVLFWHAINYGIKHAHCENVQRDVPI